MRTIVFFAAMAAICAMAIPVDVKLPTWSELTRAGRPVKTMNVVATVRPVKIDMTDITTMPVGMLLANPLHSGSPTGGVELVSFGIPREWSEGGKSEALRVSDIMVDCRTKKILGAKGSYVYPTVAEGAFALTNQVRAAVVAASKGEGTFYPLSVGKDGSGTIRYEWKSGGREVEFVIRCFVNSFRQMAVAYYIHAKGDGIHCELSPPKGK